MAVAGTGKRLDADGAIAAHAGGARVPLATTRLGLRRSGPRGPFVDERDNADTLAARRLRAVGSPDDVIGALPADPIANVVEANARRDLVEHTKIAADAQLIECRHLMLSALGGWLDAEGRWDVPPGTGLVAHWSQRIAMGRDGNLPLSRAWGHVSPQFKTPANAAIAVGVLAAIPILLVGPIGGITLSIAATDFLVVTQHVRRYPSMRELPFVEAEIMIGQTPELSRNEAAHAIGPGAQNAPTPFWSGCTTRPAARTSRCAFRCTCATSTRVTIRAVAS